MKNFAHTPIAFACVLLSQAAIAYAGDDDDLGAVYGDKTISIATGAEQAVRRAPAVATVITADDIEKMGARNLEQVLETVPGLHVARSGIAWEPLIIVRGVYSASNPQVLVLQNGVPMTIMFTGSRGLVWGDYPVQHIARIEIIRGPGSALYGADAYSGVINIITKGANETPGTQFGAGAGSFKTRDLWIQHGGKLGPVSVAAYLRFGKTDGQKEIITADLQTTRDARFGTKVSLAPGPVNTGYDSIDGNLDLAMDKWRFRVGYKRRDNLGTGAGIAPVLDPVGKLSSERITSDITWTDHQFAKDWAVGVVGSYLAYKQIITTHFQLAPPGTKLPTGTFTEGQRGHPDFWDRNFRVSAYTVYSGFKGHTLRVGLGHEDLNTYKTRTIKNFLNTANGTPIPQGGIRDYTIDSPFMLPQRRKVNYFYAQDVYQFLPDWSLTAGIRHDKFSDVGATTNPRLALVWDASLNLTAKLLYGQAFRAPAFNELYGINNPVNKGNPDLEPETIKTLEAAIAWENSQKTLQINLNLYRSTLDKIIRLQANKELGTGSTFANTGQQVGKGLELEAIYAASRTLHLAGSYSYQKSTDSTNNADAGFAPHHHVFARADWKFANNWAVTPQFNWVAGRKREFGDTRPQVPDYKSINLSLRTTSLKNFSVTASILNLFNANIREPSSSAYPDDLPMAGRSFYIQVIYKM